jgi:23S rRNA (uridine2552-2'-O)-methyltransferase
MNTCGNGKIDHLRSVDLAYTVLSFSKDILVPGGKILCKVLRGGDEKELLDCFKENFQSVKLLKPDSSRSESPEIYIYASVYRYSESNQE